MCARWLRECSKSSFGGGDHGGALMKVGGGAYDGRHCAATVMVGAALHLGRGLQVVFFPKAILACSMASLAFPLVFVGQSSRF
jgi:hypothetical protein